MRLAVLNAQPESHGDLGGYDLGMITHGEGRKPQYPVPADVEPVVAAHVGPPCCGFHVPEPVDLGDDTYAVPDAIKPPRAPPSVPPHPPPRRSPHPLPPAPPPH